MTTGLLSPTSLEARAEAAGLDGDALRRELRAEMPVERLTQLRWRGAGSSGQSAN